jgi:hypothetical protein
VFFVVFGYYRKWFNRSERGRRGRRRRRWLHKINANINYTFGKY